MSINWDAAKSAWDVGLFGNFDKSMQRIPVTGTEDNASGGVTYDKGTPVDMEATFFERANVTDQFKQGLLENADAIILVKPTQTLNKDDFVTYGGREYQVLDEPMPRGFQETVFYIMANLFRTE